MTKKDNDDDRFGDLPDESETEKESDIFELGKNLIAGLILLYVILYVIEALFNIPIPLI